MRNVFAKTVFGLLGLIVVCVGTARAQSEESDRVQPRSASPFDIASAVNRSNRLWKKHRLEQGVDLGDTWEHLGIDAGDFGACGGGSCEAAISRHDLDPTPGREVILKLTQSYNSCRFLVFVRGKHRAQARRWKLRGYVDHDFNRYQMASHRVVQAFGKNWLVVRGQEGSGSGYALYAETWFEVSKRGVKPVLHYSVEGRMYPGFVLNWELKGRAVALTSGLTRLPMVRVDFGVKYITAGFEDFDFTSRFINRRKAYYFWNSRSREFVFSGNRSTISEHEMNVVANVETDSSAEDPGVKIGGSTFFSGLKGFVGSGFEMFLRLNRERLKRIAQGPESRSKEWLRRFVMQCDDIPEKLALEKALQAHQPLSRNQR